MTSLLLAFALCRALAAGAVAVLFGAGAMLALGGSPRLGLEAEAALRRVFRLAGSIGLAATLCLLPLQAASIAGDWHATVSYTHLDVYKRQHSFSPKKKRLPGKAFSRWAQGLSLIHI